jgi:hypothetical protein
MKKIFLLAFGLFFMIESLLAQNYSEKQLLEIWENYLCSDSLTTKILVSENFKIFAFFMTGVSDTRQKVSGCRVDFRSVQTEWKQWFYEHKRFLNAQEILDFYYFSKELNLILKKILLLPDEKLTENELLQKMSDLEKKRVILYEKTFFIVGKYNLKTNSSKKN